MRMERRRSSLTPCWPRLEAGDTRLEVEEPIFQLEQVSGTREPAARDQEQDQDTSLPHHHWQRWRPRQVSTRSKCIILSYKRAPYQNIYREITPTNTFTVQGAEEPPHDSISPLPLSADDKRKYKKGNKHKGDYCFVDLGLEPAPDKRRSSSFSCSQHKPWKTLTFNKK